MSLAGLGRHEEAIHLGRADPVADELGRSRPCSSTTPSSPIERCSTSKKRAGGARRRGAFGRDDVPHAEAFAGSDLLFTQLLAGDVGGAQAAWPEQWESAAERAVDNLAHPRAARCGASGDRLRAESPSRRSNGRVRRSRSPPDTAPQVRGPFAVLPRRGPCEGSPPRRSVGALLGRSRSRTSWSVHRHGGTPRGARRVAYSLGKDDIAAATAKKRPTRRTLRRDLAPSAATRFLAAPRSRRS